METVGSYSIVGPHADAPPPDYATLVLDANVLVDIREFYFGGRIGSRESLRELLLRFPAARGRFVDVNYGWAASELSWRRGEGQDRVGYRRVQHAGAQVLSWDAERIEREFASPRPPADRDKAWPRRVPIQPAHDVADPRPLLIAPYGSLLYLLALERRRKERKSRGREWALKTYSDWVTDTLGVRTSYAQALATGLLAGHAKAQTDVRAILKFSGSETADELARKAWNVAWDITMTALSEGLSYGLMPGISPTTTALVTRDADPRILRAGSELRGLIDTGTEKIPFAMSGMGVHESVSDAALQQTFEMDPLEALTRFNRDPEAVLRQAVHAVHALEMELGVTKLTMFDNWML